MGPQRQLTQTEKNNVKNLMPKLARTSRAKRAGQGRSTTTATSSSTPTTLFSKVLHRLPGQQTGLQRALRPSKRATLRSTDWLAAQSREEEPHVKTEDLDPSSEDEKMQGPGVQQAQRSAVRLRGYWRPDAGGSATSFSVLKKNAVQWNTSRRYQQQWSGSSRTTASLGLPGKTPVSCASACRRPTLPY